LNFPGRIIICPVAFYALRGQEIILRVIETGAG